VFLNLSTKQAAHVDSKQLDRPESNLLALFPYSQVQATSDENNTISYQNAEAEAPVAVRICDLRGELYLYMYLEQNLFLFLKSENDVNEHGNSRLYAQLT
jgi:hypothetical protein